MQLVKVFSGCKEFIRIVVRHKALIDATAGNLATTARAQSKVAAIASTTPRLSASDQDEIDCRVRLLAWGGRADNPGRSSRRALATSRTVPWSPPLRQ